MNHGDLVVSRHLANHQEYAVVRRLVEGQHLEVLAAQAWKVGSRETRNRPPLARGVSKQAFDLFKTIVDRRGDTRRGECDAHEWFRESIWFGFPDHDVAAVGAGEEPAAVGAEGDRVDDA